MALTDVDSPDLEAISISIPEDGIAFPHFLTFEYDEHFLTPSDSWRFSLDQDELSAAEIAALEPGFVVNFNIVGLKQSTGIIDEVTVDTSRGTVIHVEGRDSLSPVVDSQVDPRLVFTPSMTVLQIVTAVFAPFGISVFSSDNTANVNAITGTIYGTKTSVKGAPLNKVVAHQVKPYPREGAFAFAARVCQREGLWIWPSADGTTVIVGQPNFTGPPLYTLQHSTQNPGANNILPGSHVTYSRKDQPNIILAGASGGGGEFSRAALKCYCVNPFSQATDEQVAAVIANYPGIVETDVEPSIIEGATYFEEPVKTLYLYDHEAHNLDELQAYCRREMSLKMRQSLQMHYEIEGCRLGGNPIAVDTTITVSDDRSNLHLDAYVLSRNFKKSAGGGTKTKVELIRQNSLVF